MNDIHFIGRQFELQTLQDLLKKKTASLVVMKGRRRIGKSRLIQEFAKDKPFMQFVGLAPVDGVGAQIQRNEFARLLSEQSPLPDIQIDDWGKLFSLLAGQVKTGRQIILFDEITWMADGDASFLAKLKNAWELYFKNNPKLILILCGSISAWIEENILSSTGYFGRISKKITLKELPLSRCNQLLDTVGFKRSAYEKLMILSLTGGVPWYIELINPAYSAADNIKSLCFDTDGILVDEHTHIFHDLFGKRSEIYSKITQYLAKHTVEYSALAEGISYTSSGKLSEYIHELVEAGYISKHYVWSLKTGRQSKICLYRLCDNYLRFYYKYIEPKLALIKADQYRDTVMTSLPGWNTMMGLQFETLVLNNRRLILQALHLSTEDLIADNIYYQRATKRHAGVQIDYLIQTRVNTLFVCEVKFSQNELKSSVIKDVKDKIDKIAMPRNYVSIPVLIHMNGVSDEVLDADYFHTIIDFSALLLAE